MMTSLVGQSFLQSSVHSSSFYLYRWYMITWECYYPLHASTICCIHFKWSKRIANIKYHAAKICKVDLSSRLAECTQHCWDRKKILLFTHPFFLPAADDPHANASGPTIKFTIKITIKFLFFTALATAHFFLCHTA